MSLNTALADQMAAILQKIEPTQVVQIFEALNDMQRKPKKKAAKSDGKKALQTTFSIRKATATAKSNTPPNRPLNSWMAFRSFYSPIFKSFQQKDISSCLKQLWAADPYKAKWAIIAKAYSLIRDRVSKELAPLDAFLNLVAPYAGALSREEYPITMGWIFEYNGKPIMKRAFVPSADTIPQQYRTTMQSSSQLVSFAIQNNYVSRDLLLRQTVATPTLTMAAQPSLSAGTHDENNAAATYRDPITKYDHAARDVQSALSAPTYHGGIGAGVDFRQIYQDGTAYSTDADFFDAFDPLEKSSFPLFDPNGGDQDDVFDISHSTGYFTSFETAVAPEFDADQHFNESILHLGQ